MPSAFGPNSHCTAGAASLTLLSNSGVANNMTYPRSQAWEHVDKILQTPKTTFLLSILSLETMVDQIQHKFKPSPKEDVYWTICMLISKAIQV
jgi:transformation/transcription domain-associated protein